MGHLPVSSLTSAQIVRPGDFRPFSVCFFCLDAFSLLAWKERRSPREEVGEMPVATLELRTRMDCLDRLQSRQDFSQQTPGVRKAEESFPGGAQAGDSCSPEPVEMAGMKTEHGGLPAQEALSHPSLLQSWVLDGALLASEDASPAGRVAAALGCVFPLLSAGHGSALLVGRLGAPGGLQASAQA